MCLQLRQQVLEYRLTAVDLGDMTREPSLVMREPGELRFKTLLIGSEIVQRCMEGRLSLSRYPQLILITLPCGRGGEEALHLGELSASLF